MPAGSQYNYGFYCQGPCHIWQEPDTYIWRVNGRYMCRSCADKTEEMEERAA